MPKIPTNGHDKVTERQILGLPLAEPKKQVFYWHPHVPGFGVRCGETVRNYVAQAQVQKNGRKRDKRLTIGAVGVWTLEDAEAKAKELIVEMQSGIDPTEAALREAGRIRTLRQLLEAARRIKEDPYYSTNVDTYMESMLDTDLTDIGAGEVLKRYRQIIQEVAARKHGPSSRSSAPGVATANAVFRGLSAAWNVVWRVEGRKHDIPISPTKFLTSADLKKTPAKDDVIPDSSMAAFWEALLRDSWTQGRDCVALMVLTGLRRSEATALRVDEYDGDAGVIRLGADRTKSSRGLELPVSNEVRSILDRRAASAIGGFLFSGSGKSGHLEEPKKLMGRLGEAGDFYCSTHGLRRTFGSQAMFEMNEVQRKMLMGHSLASGGVTQAHYSVASTEALRPYAQAVSDRIIGMADDPEFVRARLADGEVVGGVTREEVKAEQLHEAKASGLEVASKNAPDFDDLKDAKIIRFGKQVG